MRKAFVCSLCHNGILGGALISIIPAANRNLTR